MPAEEGTPVEEPEAKPAARKARKPAAPEAEDDAGDEVPLSAEALRAELDDIGTRAKGAGLRPFRQMVRSYLDNALDAVDGLLGALEGNKRKKGD